MTDLTKITTPFGLLDKETQDALRAWGHGWDAFGGNDWQDVQGFCSFSEWITYRARPAPLVPDTICWEHVAPEWKFMARDEDGTVWLCDGIPSKFGDTWGGAPNDIRAVAFASYKRGTVAWQDSLVERPA